MSSRHFLAALLLCLLSPRLLFATVSLQSAATYAVRPASCASLPAVVTSFPATASGVVVVFVVAGHKAGDIASIEYITPAGRAYPAASGAWSPVTASEEAAARFCFLDDVFTIAGAAPAEMTGVWTIRIGYNGVLLTTLTFTITGPGSTTCSYALSAGSAAIAAAGGTGSVNVTTGASCGWTAASNAAWLSITGTAAGTGPGTVRYQVQANEASAVRTGVLTVAGQAHTVTQAGAVDVTPPSSTGMCAYVISPEVVSVGAAAATVTVQIATTAGCAWTAASQAGWVTVATGSGKGPGSVSLRVAANDGMEMRSGRVVIADALCTVEQQVAAPALPPVISSVVSAADLPGRIAPGMRVLVRGSSLAMREAAVGAGALPLTLGGASVEVTAGKVSVPAALFSVAGQQIGVQLPYTLAGNEVELKVKHAGGTSAAFRTPIVPSVPAIAMDEAGVARVVHLDGAMVNGEAPAVGSETVGVYVTGLGAVSPEIAAGAVAGDGGELGPIQRVMTAVSATIDGRPVEVTFAGLAPRTVGLYLVKVQLPSGVEQGKADLQIATSDGVSKAVGLATASIWEESGGGAIGVEGGMVSGGGITVRTGAGVFGEAAALRVRRTSSLPEAKGDVAYLIDGVPRERNGEVTVELEWPGAADGETRVAVKEDGGAGTWYTNAVVTNGRLTIRVPAGEIQPADAKAQTRRAAGKVSASWMIWTFTGWDFLRSPSGRFTLFFAKKQYSELGSKVRLLAETLDAAYGKLTSELKLSWEARTSWPMEVTIEEFTGADAAKWGEESGTRYGKMCEGLRLNTMFMKSNEQMKFMMATAGHELFHILQNLYDSRFGSAIAYQGGSSPWFWFEEAAATYFERLVAPDPESYIPPTLKPDTSKPSASSDNFAFVTNGLGQINTQEHGYGASMFLQFAADEIGPHVIGEAMKQIGRGTPTSNFVRPLNALQDALGGASIVAHWTKFSEKYIAGQIYGKKALFPTPELFIGMSRGRHVFTGPDDRGTTFEWTAPPLSANLFVLNFRNANFRPDTPLRLDWSDANHFSSAPYVYKTRPGNSGASAWEQVASTAGRFEFLNAETFGPNSESLVVMAINPWLDPGKQKLLVRAGQPKFFGARIRLGSDSNPTGASLQTDTIQDGTWRRAQITINGNTVTMSNCTTSGGGQFTYSVYARFVIKGPLLEKVSYYYTSDRPGDRYEYQVELKNVPRTEVVNSFDEKWYVFEAGTAASKVPVADVLTTYRGVRIYQGKTYEQAWNPRDAITIRLLAPEPE